MAYKGIELVRIECGGQQSSGFFISPEWVLTVKHGVEAAKDVLPSAIKLMRFDETGRRAGEISLAAPPILCASADLALLRVPAQPFIHPVVLGCGFTPKGDGRPTLFVVRAAAGDAPVAEAHTNYSIGNLDAKGPDYNLVPETARGHSGGALCFGGVAHGVLTCRKPNEPLSRAAVIGSQREWIEQHCKDALWEDADRNQKVLGMCAKRLQELIEKDIHGPLLVRYGKQVSSAKLASINVLTELAELHNLISDGYLAKLVTDRKLLRPRLAELKNDLHEVIGVLLRMAVVEPRLVALVDTTQAAVVYPASRVGLASVAYYFSRIGSEDYKVSLKFSGHGQRDWIPNGAIDLGLATCGVGAEERVRICKELCVLLDLSDAFTLDESAKVIPEQMLSDLRDGLAHRQRRGLLTALCVMGLPTSTHLDLRNELGLPIVPYTGEEGALFCAPEGQIRAAVLQCISEINKLQ